MDTGRFLTWQNIDGTQGRLILGLLSEELKALPESTLEASSSRPKSIDLERSPQTLLSRAPTEALHIGTPTYFVGSHVSQYHDAHRRNNRKSCGASADFERTAMGTPGSTIGPRRLTDGEDQNVRENQCRPL
jgi:hypothetical protein